MGACSSILPSGYCPASAHLIDLDVMGADLVVNHTSPRGIKSIDKKLADLYSRRTAVESLIRCLESYAECQVKNGGRVRLKSA
jgi:hypothetical protein